MRTLPVLVRETVKRVARLVAQRHNVANQFEGVVRARGD